MVAAQQLQPNPLSTAEDLRKQVIRLMQNSGEDTRGNILVLPQVFLEFLDYDHKMALFLNHLLYWQSRTKHPERWVYKSYHDLFNELGFKESVIRRLLHGDPKTRQHRRTLTEIGVEVKVKRAPNGSPTNHFRINLDIFLGAIQQFLDEKQGVVVTPDPVDSTGTNPRDSQVGRTGIHELDHPESAETLDQKTPTQTPSEVTSTESSDLDEDLQIFLPYQKRFGRLRTDLHEPLRTQLARLGASRVGEVLARCATRGRSFKYVLRALENEAAAAAPEAPSERLWGDFPAANDAQGQVVQPAPESALQPVSERVYTPWRSSANGTTQTVQDAWNAAFHQMEMQLDRASYDSWLRGAILVDFKSVSNTFVVLARNELAVTMLRQRLYRSLKRILSDVYGRSAEIQFVTADEWAIETPAREAVGAA